MARRPVSQKQLAEDRELLRKFIRILGPEDGPKQFVTGRTIDEAREFIRKRDEQRLKDIACRGAGDNLAPLVAANQAAFDRGVKHTL